MNERFRGNFIVFAMGVWHQAAQAALACHCCSLVNIFMANLINEHEHSATYPVHTTHVLLYPDEQ
jgi:hypothetical protein